jgi:hypothetical protein
MGYAVAQGQAKKLPNEFDKLDALRKTTAKGLYDRLGKDLNKRDMDDVDSLIGAEFSVRFPTLEDVEPVDRGTFLGRISQGQVAGFLATLPEDLGIQGVTTGRNLATLIGTDDHIYAVSKETLDGRFVDEGGTFGPAGRIAQLQVKLVGVDVWVGEDNEAGTLDFTLESRTVAELRLMINGKAVDPKMILDGGGERLRRKPTR